MVAIRKLFDKDTRIVVYLVSMSVLCIIISIFLDVKYIIYPHYVEINISDFWYNWVSWLFILSMGLSGFLFGISVVYQVYISSVKNTHNIKTWFIVFIVFLYLLFAGIGFLAMKWFANNHNIWNPFYVCVVMLFGEILFMTTICCIKYKRRQRN